MNITISMKDPDGVSDAIDAAAKKSIASTTGLDDEEKESLMESRRSSISEAISPWVEYGEYIVVEIDTDAKTATVKKVKP